MQQTFRLKSLHKHSGFTSLNLKDNIALRQWDGHVKLSDKVNTVCFPDRDPDLNSICYITGLNKLADEVMMKMMMMMMTMTMMMMMILDIGKL